MSFYVKTIFGLGVLSILVTSCVFLNKTNPDRSMASLDGSRLRDLPWEISNNRGEIYLPDIYYSADFQNEQLVPMGVKDGLDGESKYAIDRVIYPTLGNPNLFVKNDSEAAEDDFLTVVLRIEENLWDQIHDTNDNGTKITNFMTSYNVQSTFLQASDGKDQKPFLNFYLKSKKARDPLKFSESASCGAGGTDSGRIYNVVPSQMFVRRAAGELVRGQVSAQDLTYYQALNMDSSKDKNGPLGVDKRMTLELRFQKKELEGLCQGLYDLQIKAGFVEQRQFKTIQETQFNSVRIFDVLPNNGDYSVVNVTDSQVSVQRKSGVWNRAMQPGQTLSEKIFNMKTHEHLVQFVNYVNERVRAGDPLFKNAAFISFNGDLHNGGSPLTFETKSVLDTYNLEAKAVFLALKELDLPMFLTIGNHDGYTAMMPQLKLQKDWLKDLGEYIQNEKDSQTGMPVSSSLWAQATGLYDEPFDFNSFLKSEKFRNRVVGMTGKPGGESRNIYFGQFILEPEQKMESAWKPQPTKDRNFVLYDAFNQWRKTFGPLNSSFVFGKNHFINMNTFEIRQHRRSGWGMYTVNYGGGVSQMQMSWIRRQLSAAKEHRRDVVLLAHHDPRGGTKGEGFPYYFKQVEFKGMSQSLFNYVRGQLVNPQLCKIPDRFKSNSLYIDCMHDGLQEWMRPDPDFDCAQSLRLASGRCDIEKMQSSEYARPIYSGYQMIHLIATEPLIRTLILGHTHYNSVEVKYNSDEDNAPAEKMVEKSFYLDSEQNRSRVIDQFKDLELSNPLRRGSNYIPEISSKVSKLDSVRKTMMINFGMTENQSHSALEQDERIVKKGIQLEIDIFKNILSENSSAKNLSTRVNLSEQGHAFQNELQGKDRELVILRMTSVADLTKQKVDKKAMSGFSILDINSKFQRPQLNTIHYFQYQDDQITTFKPVRKIEIDRRATSAVKRLE